MIKILTIIVPTYNMETYLDKSLSSLMVGEYDSAIMQEFEVLVVNDGSTDRSSEIAHEYESRFPDTFKVIDKENGNYGSCINAALPIATGKYVKILDADDYFDSDAFLFLLNQIRDLDVDVILTEVCEVYTSGESGLKNKNIPMEECKVLSWQAMIPFSRGFMFAHNFTYRRQLLIDIDYHQTEGYYYTDNEWVAYPMTVIQTVYYCPIFLYNYLVGRNGQSVSPEMLRNSLASFSALLLSLGKLWHHYQGDEQRKSILYNVFVLQIRYIYQIFAFARLFSWSDFRKFDQELTGILPEIESVTNRIVIGGKTVPMPIIKYFREERYLLFLLARFRYFIVGIIK